MISKMILGFVNLVFQTHRKHTLVILCIECHLRYFLQLLRYKFVYHTCMDSVVPGLYYMFVLYIIDLLTQKLSI